MTTPIVEAIFAIILLVEVKVFFAVVKKAQKEASTGIEPMTSAIPQGPLIRSLRCFYRLYLQLLKLLHN